MTPPAIAEAVAVSAFAGVARPSVARPASWLSELSSLTRPRIAVLELATVGAALWLTGGRPESPLAAVVLLLRCRQCRQNISL